MLDRGEVEDGGYETGGDNADADKFHYVITHEQKRRIKLPKYIELNNPFPGEPKMMIKRS